MKDLAGRTAFVTGAASGIGRALAHLLASKGAHLALADVNEAGLRETAAAVAGGGETSVHIVDVKSRDAVYAFAAEVVVGAHHFAGDFLRAAGVAAVVEWGSFVAGEKARLR